MRHNYKFSVFSFLPYALIFSFAALAALSACGGAAPIPCPDSHVDFAEHITPRLQRDCQRCHNAGLGGFKISADDEDYSEIMRYVVPGDAKSSKLLDKAAGKDMHPVRWSRGSENYACVARWIDEGALEVAEIPDAGSEELDAGSGR